MIGQTLSHFRITAKLGEGGMGEVYRAEDTKLGREVAVKVLPAAFTEDPERFARFEREAHLLASLNHPNIAAIHDLAEDDGTHFLVLELAEGEDLASRLSRGPIDSRKALPIALQIAEALEAAHEKGIVHRDLKPGNLMVSKDGKVKVLDFGLAKAWQPPSVDEDLSRSPTLTAGMTRSGAILGTAAYMSPEQARGEDVDRRADIWAFGCVLFEMLTGRSAFGGKSVAEALAAVLEHEPEWERLPRGLPLRAVELLRRCLRKDPHDRLHDIADARIELAEVLAAPGPAHSAHEAPVPGRRLWPTLIPVSLALIAATAFVVRILWEPESPRRAVTRFVVSGTENIPRNPGTVAISPDGRFLVYRMETDERTLLVRHDLDELVATPIRGTEGAYTFFISPDSRSVGFADGRTLKRVPIEGGVAEEVADRWNYLFGGSWGTDGQILGTEQSRGLIAVSSEGGSVQTLFRPAEEEIGLTYAWAESLPGGRGALFNIAGPETLTASESSIAVGDRETGEVRILLRGGAYPRYAASGHLLFARDGALWAAPFDADLLELTGSPVKVIEGLNMAQTNGSSGFAVSSTGTLVYAEGGVEAGRSLVWVDRTGGIEALPIEPEGFHDVVLSPDGRRLVANIGWLNHRLWLYDLERGTRTQFTFEGDAHFPLWTADGKRLIFNMKRWSGQVDAEKGENIVWKPVDQSSGIEVLTPGHRFRSPASVTPDGRSLLVDMWGGETALDCWLLDLEEPYEMRPVLDSPQNEAWSVISPDGRWVAYQSLRQGRREVYVQPFPDGGAIQQVSWTGGEQPKWSPAGGEMFYRADGMVMTVPVETSAAFQSGEPVALFPDTFRDAGGLEWDVTSDGQRFLMIQERETWEDRRLVVVLNWFEELKRIFAEQAD